MASFDSLLVDANILIYSTAEESEQFSKARQRLAELEASGCRLWVSPQILREMVAVLTRENYFVRPLTREQALDSAAYFSSQYRFAVESADVTARLLGLLRTSRHGGARIHDVNIVATALEHGIGGILTANLKHFAPYASLLRIEPL